MQSMSKVKSMSQEPKVEQRYYRFSQYLNKRFGYRVHKISIDAGFSCPNRDGTTSKDGCIYCDNKGFSYNTRKPPLPIEIQIKEGVEAAKKRFKAEKFIVYFQAYTNTYAPLNILKERYNKVKEFDDIVGISIGTRPDCINDEILDLIESFSNEYEVWIEYGLQSIHDKTLEFINRGHNYSDFLKAFRLTKRKPNIKICAHVIIGLPNEMIEDILETAKDLGNLKIDGVKIHPLHVIRGTRLESLFNEGKYKPLSLEEYADFTCGFLEYLWPETMIQRITADCPKEYLAAPLWILDKHKVTRKIENKLESEKKYQGRLFKENYEVAEKN